MKTSDYVVILHGIFRTKKHMRKLSAYLERLGYDVLSLNYPSTKYPLEKLRDIIWEDICVRLKEEKPIHFVGYSMGGLLLRAILNSYCPAQLGRTVLLGVPNKGSEVADILKNIWLYKKLYGPAGQQLITNQTAIAHLFGKMPCECGVVAGNLSLDPVSSFFIKGKDDGKVSLESAKLPDMKDYIIIRTTHTWLPYNKDVHYQTAYFLQYGVFQKTKN